MIVGDPEKDIEALELTCSDWKKGAKTVGSTTSAKPMNVNSWWWWK